eukprot:1191464-Prorocentrum_minimum.AAC.1
MRRGRGGVEVGSRRGRGGVEEGVHMSLLAPPSPAAAAAPVVVCSFHLTSGGRTHRTWRRGGCTCGGGDARGWHF